MTGIGIQLDLFGELEAEEQANAAAEVEVHRQACDFLASPWPELLCWWVDPAGAEKRLDRGKTLASYRRGRAGEPDWEGWAWATWTDGLRFEPGDSWSAAGGWRHRPRHVIPWATLHKLRDNHPTELAELRRLSAGRGTPHSLGWRWFACPAILTPWGWHPSYYESEREQDYYSGDTFEDDPPANAYADRMAAWALVIEMSRRLGPGVQP